MLLQRRMKVLKSCPAYQMTYGDTLCVLAHVLRAAEWPCGTTWWCVESAWLTESGKIWAAPSCFSVVSVDLQNVGRTETYSPARSEVGRQLTKPTNQKNEFIIKKQTSKTPQKHDNVILTTISISSHFGSLCTRKSVILSVKRLIHIVWQLPKLENSKAYHSHSWIILQ